MTPSQLPRLRAGSPAQALLPSRLRPVASATSPGPCFLADLQKLRIGCRAPWRRCLGPQPRGPHTEAADGDAPAEAEEGRGGGRPLASLVPCSPPGPAEPGHGRRPDYRCTK